MTEQEKLRYCKICVNRKFDPSQGVVCTLTSEKPTFIEECESFIADKVEAQRLLQREKALQESEESGDAFALEQKGLKKGAVGGLIMMIIAVVWFVVGWAAGRIFFYPPVLFIIGLVGLVKGIAQKNWNGKK